MTNTATLTPALPAALAGEVLRFLQVDAGPPSLGQLDALIGAYGRSVPWESASRIARRAAVPATADCPRWSEQFWAEALRLGTGGTCFESNRAFFALLRALGYQGYLTINNMGDHAACHTAIVLELAGRRWLVDAGYPLYAALPLEPSQASERASELLTYTARPVAPGEYLIENRPHPTPYVFNLIDRPVADADYCRAATADYHPSDGLFLKRIVIRKVADGRIWRFDSDARPFHLQAFHAGERADQPISGNLASALNQRFGIDQAVLTNALAALGLAQA